MSLETSAPHRIPATPSFPVRRRFAVYFTGGVQGLATLSSALHGHGYRVHDLSVDMHDGVAESSMVCTVMLPGAHVDDLLAGLRALSGITSAELL